MAKFLAREIVVKIGDTEVGATEIKGLTSIDHSVNDTDADATTFDSTGPETINVFTQDTITLEGKADPDDPGQIAVDALKRATGSAKNGKYWITLPNGDKFAFTAKTGGKLFGGSGTDVSTWSANLTVSNGITFTAHTP